MNDRDHFAAAALAGLLAAPTDKDRSMDYWARLSYEAADAMLRGRERVAAAAVPYEKSDEKSCFFNTNHDAVPAAIAQLPEGAHASVGGGSDRLRLTDDEREAIRAAVAFFSRGYGTTADTLRGLLERLG
jgi:hypothetical protein